MAEEKEVKAANKLTKKEALAELKVLAESVEFDEEYSEKTDLKTLQKLVKEGRKALAEAEDGDEEGLGSEDDESEENDEDVELEESTAPKGKGVQIFDKDGKHVRTYTIKENGKEYRALAKEFLEKNEGKGYTSRDAK